MRQPDGAWMKQVAQIAGLSFATLVTLVLVPLLYTIAIKDLKVVRWAAPVEAQPEYASDVERKDPA